MSNLTRWDPFREMLSMRSALDRMFENSLATQEGFPQNAWNLALDVSENSDEYTLKASIPGIDPDDLNITFNNNVLTISGETKSEQEKEDERYHLRERRYGSFSRSVTLPSTVKGDEIQAGYDAGVLTLHIPKAEEARPKRISVHTGHVIEGKAKA